MGRRITAMAIGAPAMLLSCLAVPARAHSLNHRVETAETVVVTLAYASGQPFAYEKYTLTPAGRETPMQIGSTDAHGRIAFVPGEATQWRLVASSADGHGVNLDIVPPAAAGMAAAGTETLPRWLLAGCGLSFVFGGFGVFQLFLRKRC